MFFFALAELRWILMPKTRITERNGSSETATEHFFNQLAYDFQDKRGKEGRKRADTVTTTVYDSRGLEVDQYGIVNYQRQSLVTSYCRHRSRMAPFEKL